VNQPTTDKDLQWLFDEEEIAPPPAATPAAPCDTPGLGQAANEPVEGTDPEPLDGDYSEEIDGEVVDAPAPRGIPIQWLIPIGIGALLIALTVLVVVLPIIQASATIIITPDRQSVAVSTMLSIQARKLFTKSLTLAQTVKTTGTAHQNASVATGYLTFYNSLPSPQTIPAGTMLTGADGVNVITEQDAYIPAGALSVNGQVTVSAHTTTTGAAANIPAGDISGACCRDYVFARNSQFAGGRAARDYRTAAKTDIQAAAQDLSRIATATFAQQAQGLLRADEASLPPQCTDKTESNAAPGTEAAQVTVTLASTCSAYAYSQAELDGKEAAVFDQAITDQLGSGYVVAGQLTEKITGVQMGKTHAQITETLAGVCSYHFSRSELLAIQHLIAGKSQTQATMLLLHTRGVQTAGVQIAQGGQTVPRDPGAISIVVFNR
jgi:hypothetical protein